MNVFGALVFFALTTIGFLRSQPITKRAARSRAFWSTRSIATLFLLGTSTLIAASIARGTFEVLTAVALIGIPIFAVLELLRGGSRQKVAT
jgi:hypothetical protein